MALRTYQVDTLRSLSERYQQGAQALCCVLPTGGGKTVIAGHLAAKLAQRDGRLLALVHRQELVDQFAATLREHGLEFGIIAAGVPRTPWKKMQVASVQTLIRRMQYAPPADYVVIDECHHARAKTWEDILSHYKGQGSKFLGLTATPLRLDGQGLHAHFDDLVVGASVKSLTEQGYLCPLRYYSLEGGLDTEGVHTRAGDFDVGQLGRRVSEKTIACATTAYMEHCGGRPTIIYAIDRAHGQALTAKLKNAGARAAYLDGDTPREARRRRLADFKAGNIDVVVNVMILTEGYDAPSCSAVIDTRPSKSLTMVMQKIGRVMRPAEGKIGLVLDLAENWTRHGLPDEPRDWALADTKREPPDDSLRMCKECRRMYLASEGRCPSCNSRESISRPVTTEERREEEMRLKLIQDGERKDRNAAIRREVRKIGPDLPALQALAARAKYQPGWAYHMYRLQRNRRPRDV